MKRLKKSKIYRNSNENSEHNGKKWYEQTGSC